MPQSVAPSRSTPSIAEQVLLGLLFLGAIAMLSLPAARGSGAGLGWMPLWLLVLPAASLLTAGALRLARRPGIAAPAMPIRRRPRTVMAVRASRPPRRRPVSRLLAAIALH